jgi:4-hydroxy-tetrahydrodipicolinate synthase
VSGSRLRDGVYTVMPTPFDDAGAVDLASVERLVRFLVDAGVDGILALGVMGEAPKLLPDERRAVAEATLRAADGRCPVVVGATHPSVAGARALAASAASLGASGVLVSPPALDRTAGADGLVDYFAAVADGLAIEIVLQDYPASSGVALGVETIARIAAEVPAVGSVKLEDPPTAVKTRSVLAAAEPGFKVFGGFGGVFFLEELDAGASGTMTGFAIPEVLKEVWRRHADGDIEGAAAVFYRFLPLIRFEFQDSIGLAIRKRIYRRRGILASDHVRPPAALLDEGSQRGLDDLLRRLGLEGEALRGGAREVAAAAA